MTIARHQLGNLKQHQSHYLQPIKDAKDWKSIAHSGGIYQIYYQDMQQEKVTAPRNAALSCA